ncbi:MAG: hypothetical protein WDW38_003930 [Sanguina aurantia]
MFASANSSNGSKPPARLSKYVRQLYPDLPEQVPEKMIQLLTLMLEHEFLPLNAGDAEFWAQFAAICTPAPQETGAVHQAPVTIQPADVPRVIAPQFVMPQLELLQLAPLPAIIPVPPPFVPQSPYPIHTQAQAVREVPRVPDDPNFPALGSVPQKPASVWSTPSFTPAPSAAFQQWGQAYPAEARYSSSPPGFATATTAPPSNPLLTYHELPHTSHSKSYTLAGLSPNVTRYIQDRMEVDHLMPKHFDSEVCRRLQGLSEAAALEALGCTPTKEKSAYSPIRNMSSLLMTNLGLMIERCIKV